MNIFGIHLKKVIIPYTPLSLLVGTTVARIHIFRPIDNQFKPNGSSYQLDRCFTVLRVAELYFSFLFKF